MRTIIADKYEIEIPPVIGRYEFVRILEHTSYSVIIVVQHRSLHFACKVVSRDILTEYKFFECFEREVRIHESIRHPNIVQFCEVIYTADLIFVIMEFCSGGDLLTKIQFSGRFCESECRRVLHSVLLGLKYLHDRNISHRDIKPDNILLDENGCPKIADFGLSHQIVRNSLLETPCGSLEYCPPEVLRGDHYDGKAVDVWSVGILLYGMTFGRLPWISRNDFDMNREIIRGDIEIPECTYPAIQRVLSKTLVLDPAGRASVSTLLVDPWFVGIESHLKQRRLSQSASATGSAITLKLGVPGLRPMNAPWKGKVIVKPHVPAASAIGHVSEGGDGADRSHRDERVRLREHASLAKIVWAPEYL
jgi:5'-AMP-activated protein kinase catalytic alpha subunit